MKKLILFYKKKIKSLIIFSIIASVFYFIYCLPNSKEDFLRTLMDVIALSLILYYFPLFSGKINSFTGGDEFFSKIPKFEYTSFTLCLPLFFFGIIGMIAVLFTKNFQVSLMFMPSLFGIKGALKEYDRYSQKINNIKN